MDEVYLISTKIWRARTLQVFYTRGKPGMSFKKTGLWNIAKLGTMQWMKA